MKIKFLSTIAIISILGALLAACGGTQNPTAVQQPPATATEITGGSAPSGSIVDAMALIQEKLQGHHDLDRILNAHHTREEWNSTLDRMIKYGAVISEDEKKIIIDYLMSRQ